MNIKPSKNRILENFLFPKNLKDRTVKALIKGGKYFARSGVFTLAHINDKINQYMNPFLKSIYPDYRFELQTLEHIENVIKHMNIVEKQKAYNYIMFYKR